MRLLIVDDHELVRRGVRSLLDNQPDFTVCGEALDGQDAVEKARTLHPEIIVMDVSMPKLNGLEATRQIRSLLPDCEILLLSQHENPEMARQALKAGARGYVVKTSVAKDLLVALTKIARKQYFFDPAILEPTATSHIDVQEILQRSAAFEQALRQSEELYRSTFELAAVGVSHVSSTGKWLRVNKRLCDILGYHESELLPLTFQDITHPEDLATDLGLTEKVRNGTLPTFSMEKRYIRKDGSTVWANLTVSAVRKTTGELDHFIAVVEDISERMNFQHALEDSKQQLVLALRSSKSAMFDWDQVARRGKWNPEMKAIYNFEPKGEYITAEEWRELFHPEDRDRLAAEAVQVWQDKTKLDFTFEFRTLPANGESKWIQSYGRLVRNADGNTVRMIGIHTDISDRKRAETALQQQQKELNEAQRVSQIGSWHWSPASDTVTWSDELYRIAGRDPKSPAVSYREHHSLYTPESWSRLQEVVTEALQKGKPYSIELTMIRADGEKRYVVARGEAQRDVEGKVTALRGTVQDITERQQVERESREAEERTRFSLEAANIGTWEWDISSGKVRWSANMESVHGQAPGSFGASFESFMDGVFVDDRQRLKEAIETTISSSAPYNVEYRQYRSDGTLGWMEAHGRVVRDDKGEPQKMFGVCADITARRNATDATSLLAAIVASSDDAIVSKTLSGTITSWNNGAERLFGYSAAEAIGQPITLIVPQDHHSEEAEILRKLSRGERVDHLETIRRRKDGSLVEISATISPVRNSDGIIIGASKVARDNTFKKHHERTLAASARQQRALFHLADELHRASSMEEINNCALNAILDALQCNRASILLSDETGVMRFKSWRGLSREYRAAVDGHSAWKPGEENPQPLCINDIQVADLPGALKATIQKEGIGSLAFIPLLSNEELIGKFMVYFNTPHSFTEDELDLSLTIARQLAFAIQRRRNDDALQRSEERFRRLSDTLDAEVSRQTDEVRKLTGALLRSQDEERRHIARELHDSAGQTLTVLGMNLTRLSQGAMQTAPQIAKDVENIQALVQQLHHEIRTASYLLHPPLLDETGLASALSWYIQGLRERSALNVKLEMPDDFARLPGDIELAIFRFVQECLTNVHRHSGSTIATISLSCEDDGVRVRVVDQGKGIAPQRLAEIEAGGSGVGIRGMQERLRQFGGLLKIESDVNGTSVCATIPASKLASPIEAPPLQAV